MAGCGTFGAQTGSAPSSAAHPKTASPTKHHAVVTPKPGPAGQQVIRTAGLKPLTLPRGDSAPPGMRAMSLTITVTNPIGTAITLTSQDLLTGPTQRVSSMTAVDQVVLPPAPGLFPDTPGASVLRPALRVSVPARGALQGNVSAFVSTGREAAMILMPTRQGLDQVAQTFFTP